MGGGGGLGGVFRRGRSPCSWSPRGSGSISLVASKESRGGAAQGKLDRVKQVIGAGAPAYAPYRQQFMQLRNANSGGFAAILPAGNPRFSGLAAKTAIASPDRPQVHPG